MGLFISSPLTEQTSTTSRNWKKTNLDCTVLTYHSLTMPCDVLFDFLWSEQNKDAQRENLRKLAHIEKVVVWNPVNCVQCLEHTFLKRTKIIKHHYISRVSSRNVLKQNLLYIYIICDSPDIESYRCTIYIYIFFLCKDSFIIITNILS